MQVGASYRHRAGLRLSRAAFALAFVLPLATPTALAQEAPQSQLQAKVATSPDDFGALFDAVVTTTSKSFWDKERLAAIGWEKRAAEARQSVVEAASLEEAARRINALLGEIKTSHTALLTPDDLDYYILMAVFGGASMPQDEFNTRFWGAGVTYAGIGHFSIRLDGRDFVDAVLEGSPAARAGLKAGDEILGVDGFPYHAIRSFRGKVGHEIAISVRRAQDAPPEILRIKVMSIAPLHAFREATRTSARVIERDGRRIGYVHVWASVGEESSDTLQARCPASASRGSGPYYRRRSGPNAKLRSTSRRADRRYARQDRRHREDGHPLFGSVGSPRRPPRFARKQPSRSTASLRGRTAVLIDHRTRSTGELFVHAYKRERQGPLIGTRTAGAVSAARAFAMPGGNLLYVAVSACKSMARSSKAPASLRMSRSPVLCLTLRALIGSSMPRLRCLRQRPRGRGRMGEKGASP